MKKENSLNVAQQGGSLISLSLWLCIVPFSRQQGHFIHDQMSRLEPTRVFLQRMTGLFVRC